jgi:hypothetical protein
MRANPFEREIIQAFRQLPPIGGIEEAIKRDHRKLLTSPNFELTI